MAKNVKVTKATIHDQRLSLAKLTRGSRRRKKLRYAFDIFPALFLDRKQKIDEKLWQEKKTSMNKPKPSLRRDHLKLVGLEFEVVEEVLL